MSSLGLLATAFNLTTAPAPLPLPPGFMEEYIKPILTQTGFAGVLLVLGYYWVGRRLSAVENAISRMVHTKLLAIAATPGLTSEAKQEVANLLEANNQAMRDNKVQPLDQ